MRQLGHAPLIYLAVCTVMIRMSSPEMADADASKGPPPGSAQAAWQSKMVQKYHLQPGCYEATYPSMSAKPVACSTVKASPALVDGVKPLYIGSSFGDDGVNLVTGSFTSVTASLPKISNVSSVKGCAPAGVSCVTNDFSLQLNVGSFVSPVCPIADPGDPNSSRTACAIIQFVYNGGAGAIVVQGALTNYIGGANTTCPAAFTQSGNDCDINMVKSFASAPAFSTLPGITLNVQANANGSDILTISRPDGQTLLMPIPDSMFKLAGNWQSAEFNVYGNGNNEQAEFNNGVTIDVSLAVATTPNATALACSSFYSVETQETSNLTIVTPCSGSGGTADPFRFEEVSPTLPICSFSGPTCLSYQNQPPNYTLTATPASDIYSWSGTPIDTNDPPPADMTLLQAKATTYAGSYTDEPVYVAACATGGKTLCVSSSIDAGDNWCWSKKPPPPPPPPNCKICTETGRQCEKVSGGYHCIGVAQ